MADRLELRDGLRDFAEARAWGRSYQTATNLVPALDKVARNARRMRGTMQVDADCYPADEVRVSGAKRS
jgi:hypothetical protein